MNPLVKKEIRLLLPSWIVALSLVVVLPWFWDDLDTAFNFLWVVLFFGMIIPAVDSFGREFSTGTFTLLMSQPVERRQIWHTKITVLFLAAVLVFAAYFISCGLRLHLVVADVNSIWHVNPRIIRDDFRDSMIASVVAMLVALTGGLWTSMLLRQTAAAFWITLLAPVGLSFLVTLMWTAFGISRFFHPSSSVWAQSPLFGLAGIYCIAGFWLAHRLFYRSQDAAWTGGMVSFSTWRYFEAGNESSVSARHRKPFAALMKKEFQLQSVSLICAGALLAVHLAVIVMRKAHGHFEPKSMAGTVSEFYWALWLVMPLLIGCTVVAEEQRLGVMEGQFCLPSSRRLQFALKFFLTIVVGLLLGGCLPLLLEGLAAMIGAPNPDIRFFNSPDGSGSVSFITVISLALGLSLVGIFASTFTKNFLQAMGIAIATIIGCVLLTVFAWNLNSVTWNHNLTIDIEILTALLMIPWLTYRNFKYFQERGRMWRRNVWGLTGAILFIFISSAALHNRAWEVFEPAEPAHGPAKLSLANPPAFLKAPSDNLLVRLPDGRVWFDSLDYHGIGNRANRWIAWLRWTINPLRKSAGPQRFLSGSNWVSAVAGHEYATVHENGPQSYSLILGYLDSVGIQPDGTLWVSGKSDQYVWTADKLTRFGNGTNWQQVAGSYNPASVLLLKKDGTLWLWGTNHFDFDWDNWPQKWPGLRAFQPYQIDTNSDWREICSLDGYLARNTSGRVWRVWRNNTNWNDELIRETNYDAIPFENNSKAAASDFGAYIRKDGTPWVFYRNYVHVPDQGDRVKFETLQTSRETNWISTAATWDWMVALKSDGTLWQWNWQHHSFAVDFTAPPTRLGIHNDWVGITSIDNAVVALAADGSLWLWPNRGIYEYDRTLLKLPKQPQFLGNVFGKAD